jgi:hypothetical protein
MRALAQQEPERNSNQQKSGSDLTIVDEWPLNRRMRLEELFGLTWSQIDHVRGPINTAPRTESGRARLDHSSVLITERSLCLLRTPARNIEPFKLRSAEIADRVTTMGCGSSMAATLFVQQLYGPAWRVLRADDLS